ncbi:DUF3397 domain-containing protein [Sporosarcina ureilytica]|uniref:Cytochrome b/b6 C-terminal region profile domain-containing protein n=1 Tax=Sporosarcina ureilytica TaxID=298596 RepID=A0A1D8JI41_9BACL|nr:DUF3397 domain-containing protein [Sporosarcina ureilytica]AOV08353.1 hypothetical protein BI350_12955 [Sporosarcina ureilytica]
MVSVLFSNLIAVIVVFPFIVSVCLLFLYQRIGRAPTIRKIADLTTPFLFFSIYMISHTIFGDGVGYTIVILALSIIIIYAVFERRRVKDFQIIRLIRKVWRLYFLLLIAAYMILILIGLVLKIIEYVT